MTNKPEPNTRAGEAFDPPCTDCGDTGVTFQTERACTCDAATRPLPQPSELVDLIERLESHMGKQDPQILLADCREAASELRAQSAQIAKLQADGDKLAEAAEPFVDNMAYLDWLEAADDDYVDRPTKSAGDYRRLFQALTACKDRA